MPMLVTVSGSCQTTVLAEDIAEQCTPTELVDFIEELLINKEDIEDIEDMLADLCERFQYE